MKISIITATYNSADTLRDTLESVLHQDYPDFEHIIIDGGSTDGTLDILRDYETKYQGRLKWQSEHDTGIYDGMNKGIALASGDIVGILNSDDFYTDSDVLSTIIQEIKDHDAIYGNVHYVKPENLKKSVRFYSSKGFRRWKMKMGFMPAHPSFYCRREIYSKYGLYDLDFKVAADFDQLFRLIYLNNINTHYIDKDFVTMRTGGISTSGLSSHRKILQDHLNVYKKHHINSNILFESVRYVVKSLELIKFRFLSLLHR